MSGGKIWVVSEGGKGSVFQVYPQEVPVIEFPGGDHFFKVKPYKVCMCLNVLHEGPEDGRIVQDPFPETRRPNVFADGPYAFIVAL